jgi:hypothetical protein
MDPNYPNKLNVERIEPARVARADGLTNRALERCTNFAEDHAHVEFSVAGRVVRARCPYCHAEYESSAPNDEAALWIVQTLHAYLQFPL